MTKLHIVQFFGADFNFALKCIIGRRLLHHIEYTNLNSNTTRGSRPGRTTHDPLNIMKQSYDIEWTERLNIVSIFNNAAGCYDRLRPNLTTITTRRLRCPLSAALYHTRALNQIRHYVRKKMGVHNFHRRLQTQHIWDRTRQWRRAHSLACTYRTHAHGIQIDCKGFFL